MSLYSLIFEADENEETPEVSGDDIRVGRKTKLAKDSVDDQIDSLFIKFESDAAVEDEEELNEDIAYNLSSFLFEVEGDVLDPAADEDAEPEGSEVIDEEEPAEEPRIKIDIDRFSSSIARLIMNYDKLLKIEMAILNRAKKFLQENQNEEHIERFEDILQNQYDIEIVDTIRQGDSVKPEAPQGVGAYDAGSGGGGG